jgi:alkylation response protein AidB-like acyl-CoA dehydrogenase
MSIRANSVTPSSSAHQAVQHPLAAAYVQLEAAWAVLVSAARGYSEGGRGGMLANAAKMACCDAGFFTLDRTLQTFGGSGYTTDVGLLEPYLLTRLFRSAPVSHPVAPGLDLDRRQHKWRSPPVAR